LQICEGEASDESITSYYSPTTPELLANYRE
jgi:hypothetical protein